MPIYVRIMFKQPCTEILVALCDTLYHWNGSEAEPALQQICNADIQRVIGDEHNRCLILTKTERILYIDCLRKESKAVDITAEVLGLFHDGPLIEIQFLWHCLIARTATTVKAFRMISSENSTSSFTALVELTCTFEHPIDFASYDDKTAVIRTTSNQVCAIDYVDSYWKSGHHASIESQWQPGHLLCKNGWSVQDLELVRPEDVVEVTNDLRRLITRMRDGKVYEYKKNRRKGLVYGLGRRLGFPEHEKIVKVIGPSAGYIFLAESGQLWSSVINEDLNLNVCRIPFDHPVTEMHNHDEFVSFRYNNGKLGLLKPYRLPSNLLSRIGKPNEIPQDGDIIPATKAIILQPLLDDKDIIHATIIYTESPQLIASETLYAVTATGQVYSTDLPNSDVRSVKVFETRPISVSCKDW